MSQGHEYETHEQSLALIFSEVVPQHERVASLYRNALTLVLQNRREQRAQSIDHFVEFTGTLVETTHILTGEPTTARIYRYSTNPTKVEKKPVTYIGISYEIEHAQKLDDDNHFTHNVRMTADGVLMVGYEDIRVNNEYDIEYVENVIASMRGGISMAKAEGQGATNREYPRRQFIRDLGATVFITLGIAFDIFRKYR